MMRHCFHILFFILFSILTTSLRSIQHPQNTFVHNQCSEPMCSHPCSTDPIIIDNSMLVCGSAVIKKRLKIKKDVIVQGKLKVEKKARFKKNVVIDGALSVGSLNIDNNISLQNVSIDGFLQFAQFTSPGVLHNNAAGITFSSLIVNADVDPAAAIADTKLATITTAGKVANSATTGTSSNIPSTLILRDVFGNFTTNMISLSGPVINPTDAATKAYVDASIPASGSSDNIPNTLVLRNGSGGFSAGAVSLIDEVISNSIIVIPFSTAGVVHNDASGNLTSSLIVNADVSASAGISDTKLATITTAGKIANSATTAASLNNTNTIVMRDASGHFITTMISITGLVTNPTDVATKAYVDAAVIPSVGTNLNIPNTLVQRDSTGSFAAQVVSVVDTVLTGNLYLGNSINSGMGNILKNGIPFVHNYGTNNTFIGSNAGNFTMTGIGRNSAVGVNALSGITNGINNIAIGYQAGQALTTGSGNVYINANAASASESSTIRIGSSQIACFIAGITSTGVSGDVVVIDNNGQLGITLSSERFKHDIQDMDSCSELIYQLRPVTFTYIDDMYNTKQYGLIAEEVDEIFPAIVAKDKYGIAYTVRYHLLPILLLNEVQKQNKIILKQQAQLDEIKEYKTIIEKLRTDIQDLQKYIVQQPLGKTIV